MGIEAEGGGMPAHSLPKDNGGYVETEAPEMIEAAEGGMPAPCLPNDNGGYIKTEGSSPRQQEDSRQSQDTQSLPAAFSLWLKTAVLDELPTSEDADSITDCVEVILQGASSDP